MEDTMLTKGQRRRNNERRRKQSSEIYEQMGPAPTLSPNLVSELGENLNRDCETWERAPAHTVNFDKYKFNSSVFISMSRLASISRTNERQITISELKLKYHNIWGKRSVAKQIASLEGVSVRVIQKYFRTA
jgi:hypothetical protein